MSKILLDGPKTPGLFQSIKVLIDPLNALDLWTKKYGETFKLRGESQNPTIVISDPEHIKTILNSPSELITSSEEDEAMKLLVGKNSMMFLDGEKHRRKRKILMPCFHKDKIIEYGESIADITEEILISLSPYRPFSVRAITKQISLRVILNALLGNSKSQKYQRLKQLLTSLNKLFEFPIFEFFLAFPFLQKNWWIWSEYLQISQEIDEILYEAIKESRTNNTVAEKNILDLLVTATDEAGQSLDDREIHDELMTLIFGGFETTSAALGWVLYWVHYLPEIKEKLITELATLQGNEDDFMSLAKLPYFDAVVSETLRLYPIAIGTFSRKVKKTFKLGEYSLEPGTRIHISIYLAHRRDNVYSEPEKFKPERFLERNFSPYEYLPFGGGERRCLGATLARFEIKAFLATILRKQINLEIVNPRPLKPVRHGIALVPPSNFEMIVNQIN